MVFPGPVSTVLDPEAVAVTFPNRIGIRLDGETPDVALEDRVVGRRVDLVDPPEIGLSELQAGRRLERAVGLALADQHASGIGPAGGVHIRQDGPQVHVVRGGELARRPAQDDLANDVRRLVGGPGLGGELIVGPFARHGVLKLGLAQRVVVDPPVVHQADQVDSRASESRPPSETGRSKHRRRQ